MENVILKLFSNCLDEEKISEKMKNLLSKAVEFESELAKSLTAAQKEIFANFDKVNMEIKQYDMQNYFTKGFCMAAKILIQIYSSND